MNSYDFLKAMNDIDVDMIEAAGKTVRKPSNVIKWIVTAASLILITGISFMIGNKVRKQQQPQVSYSLIEFSLDDKIYCAPVVQQCSEYNLVDDASTVISVQMKQPDESDLGDEMGSITVKAGKKNIICKVYYYNEYNMDDEICIVPAKLLSQSVSGTIPSFVFTNNFFNLGTPFPSLPNHILLFDISCCILSSL